MSMLPMILDDQGDLTYCGGPVHYRVLTHESSLGIIKDDKFDWLIDPSVAKAKLNAFTSLGDPTMPQTTREVDDV